MARADKARPDNRKAEKKPKADNAQGKKNKKNGQDKLQEQVLALGGDKEDLALLKGVDGDRDLVQGEQAADVRTTYNFIRSESSNTLDLCMSSPA